MTSLFGDLLVIDCASFIAGPAAATIMSDFGARVIKIEPPGAGDSYRQLIKMPGIPQAARDYYWTLDNRNKESLALDLKADAGEGFAIYPDHNLHMLLYAASMDGQGARAIQAGKDYAKRTSDAMYHALTLVRFGRFDEVIELTRRPEREIPGAAFDFAMGYAKLKLGEPEFAKAYLAKVKKVAETSKQQFRTHPAEKIVGVLAAVLMGCADDVGDDRDDRGGHLVEGERGIAQVRLQRHGPLADLLDAHAVILRWFDRSCGVVERPACAGCGLGSGGQSAAQVVHGTTHRAGGGERPRCSASPHPHFIPASQRRLTTSS